MAMKVRLKELATSQLNSLLELAFLLSLRIQFLLNLWKFVLKLL